MLVTEGHHGSALLQPLIPTYRPDLSGNERKYVLECLDTSWISSIGVFINRFERACAETINVWNVIAVTNGTAALHLALHCLGLKSGDEVIVPTFTYIASVNTIVQTGATPVFVDCRPGDWLIDPEDVARKITPRTKAIMAVHLYGAICDMAALTELASAHGLAIIEDCAEALGSTLHGRHAGTFGDVGTFSFFGNKTITTGEGGLVVTANNGLAERMRLLKGQGQSSTRRYWHVERGFNYRMTNICAAIGLAQIERLPEILARKRYIAARYRELLARSPVTFQAPAAGVASSEWLVSLLLPPDANRDLVMAKMHGLGVETRPVFHCAHQMPMYAGADDFPVAQDIAGRGISLPSFPALSDQDIDRIVATLQDCLRGSNA